MPSFNIRPSAARRERPHQEVESGFFPRCRLTRFPRLLPARGVSQGLRALTAVLAAMQLTCWPVLAVEQLLLAA